MCHVSTHGVEGRLVNRYIIYLFTYLFVNVLQLSDFLRVSVVRMAYFASSSY